MGADLYFFFNDRLHISNTAASLTASDTDPGYAIDNVREPDLIRAWKGGDSTTVDKWLQVDGGSTTWLGGGTTLAFAVLAYDNRGADQDSVNLNYDATDNPAMPAQSTAATWTISGQKTEVTMEWKSFSIPSTAKRYYRLLQPGGARTEPTGSITAKILCWGMFSVQFNDLLRLSVDYPGDAEGSYRISQAYRTAMLKTASGQPVSNLYAQSGQRFTVTFQPASDALYVRLRDALFATSGPARAIFVQKEGVRNAALANFFLCRLTGLAWGSSRFYRDQYDIEMEFETEPWL